ncbi:FadR/GntR family transcriptional regulator [Microbacterium sp. SA39]|uniref:FadR/GntR family transcriptional regulator n=1 Tax=Microbacterium sp. SA39 TaxID=1263625 RepID=UPI0005FA70A3|nr:FCD domain-containing protein [Microbacterium sp. SA39]KJQ53890.1 Pyruvate dehydrogenase complex repressor [Microbacterium sp. SA39]
MKDGTSTQRARVADDLLREIREGLHPVGGKLPSERQLAETYGVSRPVVREALGMLSMLDVIDVQMGRGAFVVNADVSTEQTTDYGLIDVVDAREAIESGALRLAAVRADTHEKAAVRAALDALERAVRSADDTSAADLELHRAIVRAARSPLLQKLWDDINDEIAQTIRVSPHGRAMSQEILADHRALAEGVIDGELVGALAATRALYDHHRDFLRSLLG